MVGDVASYTKNEIISILEFFIDNVFVEIEGLDFFSKSSVFPTEQTDPPTMPIFSLLRWGRIYANTFQRKNRICKLKPLIWHSIILYWWCSVHCLPCRSTWVILRFLSGVRVTRSLFLCVYFVDLCLFFCSFSLAIALSVLLRFTDSDYPFGIINLFILLTGFH